MREYIALVRRVSETMFGSESEYIEIRGFGHDEAKRNGMMYVVRNQSDPGASYSVVAVFPDFL